VQLAVPATRRFAIHLEIVNPGSKRGRQGERGKDGVPVCPIAGAHGRKRVLYIGLPGSTCFGW